MNTNTHGDFQIYIKVPLMISVLTFLRFMIDETLQIFFRVNCRKEIILF